MKSIGKKIGAGFFLLILLFSLTACGNSNAEDQTNTIPESDTTTDESTPVTDTVPDMDRGNAEGSSEGSSDQSASNILVAYFSLAGEQYNVGVIEEGNTSIIAHMIAEQTGADLFEIEAVTPYPETHSELLEVSQEEMSNNARPEITGTVENMADYDTVFIGYPNWWGDMPMIVYNFIESYDFSGKTIVPFCTHGGSGLSGTESTIEDITGAAMMDGFAISGETAQNDRETSLERVTEWLREVGYVE
ncbi:flavodoxin [Dysosmobacter welbionis]|uniref:flavodoxin n=1 Tax=Dysosmobacter welbionis TaxID=2093857 RepID=UPI0032BFA47A